MHGSLEQRQDGSVALFIKEDLQFDSRDERIYHESLALPPLALALSRQQADLRILIIGGGDGLIARELFKSNQIAAVDLVDYDPQILEFARRDLAHLNENSLAHARMQIHVRDAWEFVDEALKQGTLYDLIICDLTVPEDVSGARFHTIDWYSKLHNLIRQDGVVAVNACSPQATPRAYCSIFNCLLRAGFDTRPYHVTIPSFAGLGYGDDWGFFIASRQSITPAEFAESFESLTPRHWLKDLAMLRQLFVFPEELFKYQPSAVPATAGSDMLLCYFLNDRKLGTGSGSLKDSFSLEIGTMSMPEPDKGTTILPLYISPALIDALNPTVETTDPGAPLDQKILTDVMDMMPVPYRDHTPQIVGDFLSDPAAFLRGLDLQELVDRLLQRAMELPSQLVAELECLRDRLEEWADDNLTVLSLGQHVLTILTLVIVLGNLLYPDMVYAKGGTGHAGGAHTASAGVGHTGSGGGHDGATGHAGARGGRRGYGRGWGGGYWGGGGGYYYRRNYPGPGQPKEGPMGPASGPPSKGVQIKNFQGSLPQPIRSLPLQVEESSSNGGASSNSIADVQRNMVRLRSRLTASHEELSKYVDLLRQDLASFESCQEPTVVFGTHNIPVAEAVRRTNLAIARTESEISAVHQRMEELNAHMNGIASQSPTNDDLRNS